MQLHEHIGAAPYLQTKRNSLAMLTSLAEQHAYRQTQQSHAGPYHQARPHIQSISPGGRLLAVP